MARRGELDLGDDPIRSLMRHLEKKALSERLKAKTPRISKAASALADLKLQTNLKTKPGVEPSSQKSTTKVQINPALNIKLPASWS